jgi:arylsulfatase A-like enzyme
MALALAAVVLAACGGTDRPVSRPNLILITIDTLRADHLGFAGYARDTSPALDRLAAEGVWFPWCYAQSATTGASHATIFTSLHPHDHGVLANREQFPDKPSLIETLRRQGYFTAAFVSSVVVGRKFGIARLFDHFDDELTTPEPNRQERYERPAGQTLDAARRLAARLPRSRPFFLWIHLIDPHGPYRPPEQADVFVGDRRQASPRILEIGGSDWDLGRIPAYQSLDGRTDAEFYVARYDAEIRYADAALGLFFDRLRSLGLYDRTVIAVTSDHGETLAEPGHKRYFAHGTMAYEEVVRVPLVVREPAGRRQLARVPRDQVVTSMDIAPTLLALLGVRAPSGFQGRNLLREQPTEGAPVFSMGAYGSPMLTAEIGTQFSVLRGPWRYILNSADGVEELYDHRVDPLEAVDVAVREPETLARLRRDVASYLQRTPAGATPVEMTPEHLERLRALGYVR